MCYDYDRDEVKQKELLSTNKIKGDGITVSDVKNDTESAIFRKPYIATITNSESTSKTPKFVQALVFLSTDFYLEESNKVGVEIDYTQNSVITTDFRIIKGNKHMAIAVANRINELGFLVEGSNIDMVLESIIVKHPNKTDFSVKLVPKRITLLCKVTNTEGIVLEGETLSQNYVNAENL